MMGTMVVPETLLPEQMTRGRYLSPVHALMVAVLEDGLGRLMRGRAGSLELEEAERWIEGAPARGGVFSFANICHELDLDPDYLRKGIRAWRTTHGARPPEAVRSRLSNLRRRRIVR